MRGEGLALLASILLGLSGASGAAHAQGCGPTRLKVTESVQLDVPPAKAWALVGDFQNMRWDHEALATVGSGGNEPDKAHRTITWRGGATFGESLYKYDRDGMSYSYHVDRIDVKVLPVQNLSATLEVLPGDDGATSVVRWRGAFYRNLAPGEGAPDAADRAAAEAVRIFFKKGLDDLKARTDSKT